MAKALKVIGVVVAVVGIVASAGALLAPAAAATATAGATAGGFLGISAATLTTIGTVAGLVAAGIGVAGALLAPRSGFTQEGNPLQFQTNPQSGLPYAMGRTRVSGLRIHADTYDAPAFKSESKQDVLAFAVMLSAGGEIEEIETFRADKETVTFNGTTGAAIGGYANWMAQKVSLGLAGASALALSFGSVAFPGWTTDHKLEGISHALWDLRFDPKGEVFPAGVPVPEWIGKWVKVYDPRLDSTYPGGSGSHRALDESTYEWSDNPALHALTWALGRWQNGKRTLGIGAPVANIRVADFVEAANVADTNSWACGGVEYSTDSKWTILKKILQAGGAEPTMTGAMIGCRVNAPRTSIATVEQHHLLDSSSFPSTKSRRDRFNTVIPRIRSEDHDWEVISCEPITEATYVTADGGPRTKEIDFPLVQKHTGSAAGLEQAGHLAAYEIVNSREAGPWRFTTGPQFIGVRTGDCITLDVPDDGIDAQDVIVRSRSVDPATLKITFEVETETASKHAYALGQTAVPPTGYTPTVPDLTPPTPDAGLWALEAQPDTDLTPAFAIVGVCEFPAADNVLMEYREDGVGDWQTLGKADATAPVRHVVNGLIAGASYEARVAYQAGSRVGAWLELSPVAVNSVALNDVLTANDQNGGTPAATSAITAITKYMDFPDGNVSYRASFDYTYDATAMDADNVDGFAYGYYPADTNAAYTMLGPDTTDKEHWSVAYLNMVPGLHTYTFSFFNNVNPVKFYKLAVAPFRKVDKSVDPKGYIIGPIVESAFFQPAATQAIGTGATVGGQTAANVGAGALKANTGLTASGNVASTTKVGGDGGNAASDVSTATTRGLAVINANNNINGTVKINGDSGRLASDVDTASGRALAAITSGNKAATNVVETISLTAETVTHLFAGATSSTAISLDGASYGSYVSVASSSFTVQEGGADVLFTGLVSVRFGISVTDSNLQFTATARIVFGGVNSNTFEVTQTVYAAGRQATVPITIQHLFEGVTAGSKTFILEVKVDDPGGTGDYAETRGVRAVQIAELKR